MTANAWPMGTEETVLERMARVFAAQKAAFATDPCPPAAARKERLRRIRTQIARYQDVLVQAMSDDFGYRSPSESRMFDLLGTMLEINHLHAHVGRWMKPSRRSTELLFKTNGLTVTYQPKGVVGVIVPWNFPIYLAVGPLAAALAAGNRVMVKMSEATPRTCDALQRMIAEVFGEDEVAVFDMPEAAAPAFTALPFDHIVFTGSSAVGRIVMETAARNLVPVTLELGGKSPAVVSRNFPIGEAARRIVHGKGSNCGQICVAPDHAVVPRESVDAFVAAAVASFRALFPKPDYTAVVNDRQFARQQALLADAVAKGATVVPCAPYDPGRDGRRLPLHIVLNGTPDMMVMQEEIFGPILPVIPYDTLDEVVAMIAGGPRPLALYSFSRDAGEREALLRRTHSGGVTHNDWGWHVVNHDAPFGGIGNSGMGTYHGLEGFRELSHAKTVFSRHRFFPIDLFYPPYGTFFQRWVLRFFLGKPDKSLNN